MVEPVALQDNLGKTPAAEKITQIEKAQPELAQRDTALVGRKRAVEQQSKPVPTDKTDEVIIHHEQEEQKKRDKQQKPKDAETKSEENTAPEPAPPEHREEPPITHLDIRV